MFQARESCHRAAARGAALLGLVGCASGGNVATSTGAGGAATSAGSTGSGPATSSGTSTSGASGSSSSSTGTGAPAELLGLKNTSGWQIYPGGGYRYGPSIIVNPDASIDMWTCSPGANGAWDYIRYRHSSDGGHTWTPDQIALSPTAGANDAFSTCDPGAIKIGAYYYIGYTSTKNSAGTQNELYLARSMFPGGPFEKWSGTGWGNTPVPIVTYGGATDKYGIGEPSLVLQGGKLFVYYTDDDATGNYTDLSIVDDPTASDWPLHLNAKGHVVVHAGAQDSLDVKYADAFGRFIALSTFDRFTSGSTIATYESADGQSFVRSPFHGARVQRAAHNVGLSGDPSGHVTMGMPAFIAYAYQPAGFSWGNWPTFLDPVTLSLFPIGTPVGGGVSSIVNQTDWNWSGPKAWDGDPGSIFSSDGHGTIDTATEWAFVDLGQSLSVASVTLTPRTMGYGYPVDFKLQSSDDGAAWADIPGASFTGHAPAMAPETLALGAPVKARFIRVYATRLGSDDNGGHYLQLAEISVGLAP